MGARRTDASPAALDEQLRIARCLRASLIAALREPTEQTPGAHAGHCSALDRLLLDTDREIALLALAIAHGPDTERSLAA